ncbi:outer membrane protein assembly factor BamB family protein [Aporhodopirellula aestuarii]|uniref:PQQ-binding-like beta-propeller repeat protein n=1 Tax=Aporhodopirellula aestuarii TaxID=2950107 RepID=A0ABT0UBP6_9BACT|nr:PQQ-binding-like beta-propeller repeat protein [Aporhodopirellula aestuarii]MCM2374210.1 PQQ-binding-like beta-propeller repeat protein [Aporhodopirellula aestuarii]
MQRYFFASLLTLCLFVPAQGNDWPEFLGPNGAARSTEVVPKTWDETKNMAWKVDLPGTGSSSPVIVDGKVIVTCYISGNDLAKRQVLCFDQNSGEQLWSVDFPIDYREDGYRGYITEHGYASNTPVTDGENVYVFLGKGGVHSISLDGQTNWSVDVGKESSNRQWGSAASLILYENSIIVNAAEEAKSIISLDKQTGEELWRQEAGMLELTYGTPRLVQLENGTQELVISVPGEIWSMNPKTGKLNWYAESPMTGNVSPSVIVDGDTVYSFGGYRASGSIAVKAGGKDDVTDSNVLWTNRSSSYVATPLLLNERFYWIDDSGIAFCTSAKDGAVIYRERVQNLQSGRPVYASPVLIGDHIYVVTRRSGTLVYDASESFKPLAQNVIASDETDFNASPAVSDGKLYLRSNQSLYCIANH